MWLFNSWQIAVASSVQAAHELIISSSLLKHKININEQKKVSSFNRGKTSIPFFKFQVHQHYSILLSGWFVRQNDRFKQTTGWSVNYEFTFHNNEFTFAIVTFFRRELTSRGFFSCHGLKKRQLSFIISQFLLFPSQLQASFSSQNWEFIFLNFEFISCNSEFLSELMFFLSWGRNKLP